MMMMVSPPFAGASRAHGERRRGETFSSLGQYNSLLLLSQKRFHLRRQNLSAHLSCWARNTNEDARTAAAPIQLFIQALLFVLFPPNGLSTSKLPFGLSAPLPTTIGIDRLNYEGKQSPAFFPFRFRSTSLIPRHQHTLFSSLNTFRKLSLGNIGLESSHSLEDGEGSDFQSQPRV